jgi:hypothetical protein
MKIISKTPPQPPPKPSRPDLEIELQRRRQAERLASLVTEFQVRIFIFFRNKI